MRSNNHNSARIHSGLAACALLLASGVSLAQSVNLTAGASTATLPDGSVVPMWGYTCSTATPAVGATCAALNPHATGWSPVVITVPSGTGSFTINLTNNLPTPVPTSLVIVGQLGGGLGSAPNTTPSPDHTNAQPATWPIAGDAPGAGLTGVGTPPAQLPRVQSFATEVANGAANVALTFNNLRPGTYLMESGTHPSIQGPMGLYGILVVTTAPVGTTTAGTAYPAAGTAPAITYNADIPLLFSEIDPVQNAAVAKAVTLPGFSETTVWSGLPGGCGNPATPNSGNCYPPAVNYTPLYYMINGVAFDKTNSGNSLFPVSPATGATGTVLVRLVNAGLRMHVPSIVGSLTTPTSTSATASGFSLIAEDGNRLPGIPRVQSEVFMAAGKTYDVMVNVPAAGAPALPVFDRELSLSGNSIARDAGMLAYIGVNGATAPSAAASTAAVARADAYNALVAGQTLTVSDLGKGVIANDTNVSGVTLLTPPTNGTVTLNANGTFTYVPSGTATSDSFTYCANGTVTGPTCSSGITATVTLGGATLEAGTGITLSNETYSFSNGPKTTAPPAPAFLMVGPPGVLVHAKDAAGYPLSVDLTTVSAISGACAGTLNVNADGSFTATAAATGSCTFTYRAKNSQGVQSAGTAMVTVNVPAATGLAVTVLDGQDKVTPITDYRWVIEEDRTFYVNPKCTTNPPPAGCPTAGTIVPTFGTNFHTSYMPVVATGCTGALSCESGQTINNAPVVCDIGDGACRTTSGQQTPLDPSQVALNPNKRYYISILPGDAGNDFAAGNLGPECSKGIANLPAGFDPGQCGHGMGGAPISFGQTAITIYSQPAPYPPAKLSVFVFEDDFPLNGEQDGGGGIDVLSPNEPGLGGFNITLFDDAGGTGDATGQMTYDMFNQPLVNSLAGTIDPVTGKDACPISAISRIGANDPTQTGITGTIVTCPKFEADGATLSPLAGQAVVANLMPGRYGVVATPGADRIGRGEEWLQTNTLDGQKAHDSFLRIGEPSFFQEFGPAGYHVSIGFANPAIINGRKPAVCGGTDPNVSGANCTNSVTGIVTTERMSRTPDERLYSSGDNSSFAFTQCYVSFGDPDGEDFAFTKCNADGSFTLSGLPDGDWRITVFDQWNDMLVDGLSTPVRLAGGATVNLGELASNQWQANIYTKSFIDLNGDGVAQDNEPGLTLVPTNIRFRDGSYSNFNNTDLAGNAGFNEVFPLFSWYVIESDSTRFKNTGTHVVYDAGGPADGSSACLGGGTAPCGNSTIGSMMANTAEQLGVPAALRVPGAVYCTTADCTGSSIATGPIVGGSSGPVPAGSTGRIDPPWVVSEGWQGFSGQNSFLEFGKKPFAPGENGGIHGEVIYASTRPFDDPALLIHTSWTPDVPGVTVNLYQVGTAADGITQTLKLVDTTKTTSWDDWAQGFRTDGVPNMNCPGQGRDTGAAADLFFFTLFNQPMYLDVYNNGVAAAKALPNNSQFKCFDGMHNWNQLQPAPYDGMYSFPSVTGLNPTTGKPAGTNCTVCVPNPDTTDPYRHNTPMLPSGKYVVEMIVPPGYELVKEEDKNILIGDNYIAPVTQEFPGLATAVYILPDQAEVAAAYNANNAQNSTVALGRTTLPSHEGDTGSVETFWPCVGQARVVPDYISLFPQSHEVAPFAGATRNLCDRKLVTLDDQTSALAKFWIFTSAHVAAHFTGVITDDYTSEFDPFSPQFGEKFSPANMPVAVKDYSGTEISRVYTDQWGTYNGLTYSTWEVNPPNPTGYAPTMMVTCMNDPGTGPAPDPLYNPAYSQFCYEIPFMPGQTQYMDTPVVPTSAFAGAGYNNPDCDYPNLTPAVSEVDGDGIGPWVNTGAGHTLKIYALGDEQVGNYAYSGPSSATAPFNQKTMPRHYGFGSNPGTVALVGADGVAHNLTGVSWSDTYITGTVPTVAGSGMNCPVQQQVQYSHLASSAVAQCGQLVITTAPSTAYPKGQQSVDTVTVTIGGKAPTHVLATGSIQSALDAAAPGDLIIVDPAAQANSTTPAVPAVHQELLLMWKPVRLQGVAAVSSVVNANTHPAGKMDVWRREVNCLFGLAINGQPMGSGNPYDPTGTYACAANANFSGTPTTLTSFSAYAPPGNVNPQIDRLPLEAVVGWDASQNGNMAELLQEPSLMGALEGAAITVLSKGMRFPAGSDPFGTTAGAAEGGTFPTGTVLLTGGTTGSNSCGANTSTAHNPFPSNFLCNPSSIDGLTVTNSSQGGGGIFVHGWGHDIQIANNRVTNNAGTLSGGINVGQGEFPGAYTVGGVNADPGSCQSQLGLPANTQLQYCFDRNVNIHHNAVTRNSSTGDELFSATPAGAGGVTICNGSDFYKFNYNWVCGNLSTGDGGGIAHIGFSYNGDIEHNTILFNQSTNPTIPTNGGGLLVMGAPDVNPVCGSTTDQDCLNPTPPAPSDGTGPNLVINANLIRGNGAESGSGGGLALQGVNGTDVLTFPTNPSRWYSVTVTNNIIDNNVAGWDGAGISLYDALNVNIINNTIVANDTTASSGALFNTIGAPLASSQGPCPPGGRNAAGVCTVLVTTSTPQPAGIVAIQNSSNLVASLPTNVTCPTGHYDTTLGTAGNGSCRKTSFPELYNNVIWQNRSFYIAVGPLGSGTVNQQNVVNLYQGFTATQAPSQPTADTTTPNGGGVIITGGTGACVNPTAAPNYWDIGVRGDTGPTNHASGITLSPFYSVLTNVTGYSGATQHNTTGNPALMSEYCNGARVPPENGGLGYQVPPGIADATVPNPVFNLTPAATIDEGNNWINISWGPLSLVNTSNGTLNGTTLANLDPSGTSSVINYIPLPASTYGAAPTLDFYGTQRKTNGFVDAGAVEFTGTVAPVLSASVAPSPLAFGNWAVGTTSAALTVTVTNTGNTALAGGTFTLGGGTPQPFSRPAGAAGGTCGAALAVSASCTVNLVFAPATATTFSRTLTVAYTGATVTGSPVTLTGTGVASRATLSIAPNPLTITLPTGSITGTGVVTLTNSAAAGGAQVAVTNVAVSGGSLLTYFFNVVGGGANTCTGATLAPGASCNVTVRFTNVLSARGTNRAGTITFTDNGAGGTQSGGLIGFATP
jgi:Bacterial Ig domain